MRPKAPSSQFFRDPEYIYIYIERERETVTFAVEAKEYTRVENN